MEAMDLDAMAESLQATIEGIPSAPQPKPSQPNSSQPKPTKSSQPTDNKENSNNRGRSWRARSGRVHRRRERVNLHQQKTLLSAVTDAEASAILKHTNKGGYMGHFRGRGKN
ncbi:uncharacterized protein LOC126748074 [Anthonomus grandis grandis]|uniref:uncharacterized protein LOC126748074 n=1 Tax=Anthonomus grandis grandis TaxID=2921223 RepID=UPI002165ED1F|nr:uncharacterized protein LOC126748074 [Anthonomus grandis grandis]XP_050313045.1 uncharacterized protein LOC126748074 [Anthonomus grandis grandis]XP_050313046.1 uncharacterized protein LOC126748074 [Anthonomus grandis grandis]XP_050313047.1 uncharacterized protein LOC126748074 [Anthonomus grandis grandis]